VHPLFSASQEPEPSSPFESTPWARDYWIGHEKEEAVEWAPWVYIRNPKFEAPHASTDDQRHRVTPQPTLPPRVGVPDRPKVIVFFLGGSTTFGWYQRAEHTFPAVAARRLQEELGEDVQVEVTNFGVPGHIFTQEILELMLQLRAGARPDVVVFLDGINDVMATAQNGEAGFPQNQHNRRADFERGRQLAREERYGLGNDFRVLWRIAGELLHRLRWVQGARSLRVVDPGESASIEAMANSSVRVYAENVRIVEALATGYGFRPVYLWQPALLSSKKPLTAREAWLRHPCRVGDLHRAIPPLLEPAVTPLVGERFLDLTELFDDDPQDVFVDTFGHTYERANPILVEAVLPQLVAAAAWSAKAKAHVDPGKGER
jgi:hypothetical protein